MKQLSLTVINLFALIILTYGQPENRYLRKGSSLYSQQHYDLSLPFFEEAARINPSSSVTQYNLGNALFKNEKYAESEKAFNRASEQTNVPAEKGRAIYNKGVALTKQKKLMESIAAYKTVLRMNPGDEDARHNLQKALRELKKQEESQGNRPEEKPNQSRDQSKERKEERSRLNQRQVENFLQALRQKEQQVQKKVQQNKNRSSSQQEKDW